METISSEVCFALFIVVARDLPFPRLLVQFPHITYYSQKYCLSMLNAVLRIRSSQVLMASLSYHCHIISFCMWCRRICLQNSIDFFYVAFMYIILHVYTEMRLFCGT